MRPERLMLEVLEMKKRFPGFKAVTLEGGLTAFAGTIHPRKHSYEIMVLLTPAYPHEAPKVFPLSPRIRSSRHQYNNGALCYHYGQEWSPSYTVCVAIGWVAHWFASYEKYLETGYWPGREA